MANIVLKMTDKDSKKHLFILPTEDNFLINEMIKKYSLESYTLINWSLETITIL